jgi:hypothetical protein
MPRLKDANDHWRTRLNQSLGVFFTLDGTARRRRTQKDDDQQKRSSWRMPDWFELGAKASELSKFLLCLTSPSAERHGDAHVYAFKRLILPCYEKHLLVLEHAVDMLAIGNRADKCPLAAINHDCDFRRRAVRSNLR